MWATGRVDREAGFTLLETLVVLAVTALIAGLSWPAAERAIAAAEAMALCHHVVRPAFHLGENPRDIFAENPDR